MTMDNLARNAMLARQANMSYGKWKALQPIVPIKPKVDESNIKTCPWCGNKFKQKRPTQIYCDTVCQSQANASRHRKRRKEQENESET
jgi:hypothetical protein